MKMFSLITFEVVERIFEERAEGDVSTMSQLIYINSLYNHFKDKIADEKNAMAFEVFIEDINNYSRWLKNFQELHKLKLISISQDRITFINHWGQFIDRSKIEIKQCDLFEIKDFQSDDLTKKLKENKGLIEVIAMKHKISKDQLFEAIDIFCKEQEAIKNKYKSDSDLTKHFIHWANIYIKKTDFKQETVKSKSKILGMNN